MVSVTVQPRDTRTDDAPTRVLRRRSSSIARSGWRWNRLTDHVSGMFWGIGLVLASLQTWAAIRAESMNADGVAYLDIADAYLDGGATDALNAVWSPLYSWALAGALRIAGPEVSEFVVVHGTNLVIFIFAFLGFAFLHRELRWQLVRGAENDRRPIPLWAWDAVSHLVFLYATLTLISIWAVTPDMLMAGFVCIAAGLIVRVRNGKGSSLDFLLLGVALGVAYLSKSVMLPLGIIFLAATALAAHGTPKAGRRVVLTVAAFLVVSVPWIVAISRHEGRVTFGDAGRITYLRYVSGIPYPYWHGDTAEFGTPAHPANLILENPPVHAFGSGVPGTNPLSFDPAYWYEGATVQFRLDQQARAFLRNLLFYSDLVIGDLGGAVACVLLLYAMGMHKRAGASLTSRQLALLMPAAAAFSLYALVYVEGRYIGVFLILAFLEGLANLRVPQATPRRMLALTGWLMIAFLGIAIASFFVRGSQELLENPVASRSIDSAPASPSATAQALRDLGIEADDGVGVIGYAFDSMWARLARVRLVAELQHADADRLWIGDSDIEARILQAFARAGARAVVAENVPAYAIMNGWNRIDRSDSYIKLLPGESIADDPLDRRRRSRQSLAASCEGRFDGIAFGGRVDCRLACAFARVDVGDCSGKSLLMDS